MAFPSRRTLIICLALSLLFASALAARKKKSASSSSDSADSSTSLFSLSTTIYAAVILIAFAIFKSKSTSKYHGKRRLSNMSQILMRGFPEKFKFPANVIYGLWEFETLPSDEHLRALVDKLYLFERFRSIVSIDPKEVRLTPRESDVKPSYDAHIVHHHVSSYKEALEQVESLIHLPFDLAHPVWDLRIINNSGGDSLLVCRIHHVLADGLGMVDVISTLITDKDGKPATLPSFGKFDTTPKNKPAPTIADRIDFAKRFLSALFKVLNTPTSTPDTLTPFRPELNQPFSGRRRLVMIPAISLEDIKKVKNAAQATVNDVISSLVAGAMRRYLEYRNDASVAAGAKPLSIRALLPYGFPRKVDHSNRYTALRNLWTFISLDLPAEIAGDKPLERLRVTKQRMDAIKLSPEAYISRGATNFAAKVLPLAAQQQTTYEVLQRHSCVFTNVPGPTELVYFGGQPIKAMHPVFVNMIPQISVFSYNGFIRGNLVVDPEVVTEPDRFASMFLDELKELKTALNVE